MEYYFYHIDKLRYLAKTMSFAQNLLFCRFCFRMLRQTFLDSFVALQCQEMGDMLQELDAYFAQVDPEALSNESERHHVEQLLRRLDAAPGPRDPENLEEEFQEDGLLQTLGCGLHLCDFALRRTHRSVEGCASCVLNVTGYRIDFLKANPVVEFTMMDQQIEVLKHIQRGETDLSVLAYSI